MSERCTRGGRVFARARPRTRFFCGREGGSQTPRSTLAALLSAEDMTEQSVHGPFGAELCEIAAKLAAPVRIICCPSKRSAPGRQLTEHCSAPQGKGIVAADESTATIGKRVSCPWNMGIHLPFQEILDSALGAPAERKPI